MVADTNQTSTLDRRPRWFHITPERFVGALIVVEIFLWLSDGYRWFAFDEKKGLPLLIALAALAISLLGFAVRFLFALTFHRRFQFGIRTLLLLTLAAAIPFSWMAASVDRAKKMRQLVERLRNEREFHIETRTWLTPPEWLSSLLGGEFFSRATFFCHPVSDLTDEDFALCCELDELETCIVSQSADHRCRTEASRQTVQPRNAPPYRHERHRSRRATVAIATAPM